MANRLRGETSPYLKQHAENPVDWWPWGPEAFAEAARLGKPVFVSIGYAACHWCHVMAHESFEDAETAAVMNARFINVKVDREERPEVDAIYMSALQVQGEGGGWPLSAFCLPDGRPFYLGTYFPPTPRFGRPSFRDMLRLIGEAFDTRRAEIEENAEGLLDGLGRVDAHYRKGAASGGAAPTANLTASLLVAAGRKLAERCDPRYGGLAGAPKFPSCSTLDVLARAARQSFGAEARAAFLRWCGGMVDGGLYDHVGGGFARYSVDERWLVPHFEKMLYDQAQLLAMLARAQGLAPEDPRWRERASETVAFLERELSDAAGGLWSSLDADSEGEEGKFYVWTPAELHAALGARDAIVFGAAYGVTEAGTFEHGASVLARVAPRGSRFEEEDLARMRARLLDARGRRVRPGTDDKVLAGWNGLAISGLLAAWRAFGHEPARALAVRVAAFVRQALVRGGELARIWGGGEARLPGTLEDYAYCALAFLDLAEALDDAAAAEEAWALGRALVETLRARFVEDAAGPLVFYLAPAGDALLVHRPESHHDSALPSGAAVAVEALLRLGLVGEDEGALSLAERYLAERLSGDAEAAAVTTSRLLGALDFYLHHQLVVVSAGEGAVALVAAARGATSPTVCLAGPWAAPSVLAGKGPRADGAAQAYVCRGATCSAPVADAAALRALLG
ncbi:MAG: thioredoxin domain-containing protein [Kofleriaceae bacterium]